MKCITRVRLLVIWIALLSPIQSRNMPSIPEITKFLKQFIVPRIESSPDTIVNFRAEESVPSIDKVIKEKIEQLKSYLQDDTFKTDDPNILMLQGKNETTVVEFREMARSENSELKLDMTKYKKLRDIISIALDNEGVTDKTKELVVNTLDEMISHMLENQCVWDKSEAPNHRAHKIEPFEIANKWVHMWNGLNRHYGKVKHKQDPETKKFLKELKHFISKVSLDLSSLPPDYKIVCHLVDPKNETDTEFKNEEKHNKGIQRSEDRNNSSKIDCTSFKMCSRELMGFWKDFYKKLNETAVNTLENYAEMYKRDAYGEDLDEKDHIINCVRNSSQDVRKKIKKIVKKTISEFQLDAANQTAYMNAISIFVDYSLRHTKKHVIKVLQSSLKDVDRKLYSSIQKDVETNLGNDLKVLVETIKRTLCDKFSTCNSRSSFRRGNEAFVPNLRNDVFVKVKISVGKSNDPNMKSELKLSARRINNNEISEPIPKIYVTRTSLADETTYGSARKTIKTMTSSTDSGTRKNLTESVKENEIGVAE